MTIALANPAVHDGSYAMLLPALLPLARPFTHARPLTEESAPAAAGQKLSQGEPTTT